MDINLWVNRASNLGPNKTHHKTNKNFGMVMANVKGIFFVLGVTLP